MKKLLTICALAGLALGVVASASAQAPGPSGGQGKLQGEHRGPGGGMRMMQQVLAKLDLSPSQKTQIEALEKKTRDQMKDLRKGQNFTPGTPPSPEMRQKMKGIMENFHKQLFTILTPAQQKQFKQEMQEMRKKWQQEHPNGARPGGAPGAGGVK